MKSLPWPLKKKDSGTEAVARRIRAAFVPAAFLMLSFSVAVPAFAAQPDIDWGQAGSAQPFKDLPGVKAQDPMVFEKGYNCQTVTVAPRLNRRETIEDVMPRIIYRCEKDGIVYQGTTPPASGWYPGVNPRIID